MEKFIFIAILDNDADAHFEVIAKSKQVALEIFATHIRMSNYELPVN